MKFAYTLLLLCSIILCRAQQRIALQTGANLLQHAYKNKSVEELNEFFNRWHEETKPIDNHELMSLNDTLKQAYHVFTAFYQPLNINSLGGSEFGSNIYDKAKFLIIQNKLDIYFADKVYYSDDEADSIAVKEINKTKLKDSIKNQLLKRKDGKLSSDVLEHFGPNSLFYEDQYEKDTLLIKSAYFRPEINCGDKQALYLINKYDTLLNAFLGNTHLPLGTGGIMDPARSTGESTKRKQFLENLIVIWYGHWGGYWQLYSYPTVSKITFDKEMKYARIAFRLIYEGGEAVLKNENGQWKLISSKRTWIE